MQDTYLVRSLTEEDYFQVEQLDKLSYSNVNDCLNNEDYAFGIFSQDKLIGYCTLGYADGINDVTIENHSSWTNCSLLLSDVYILKQYRGKRLATQLINQTFKLHPDAVDNSIFLILLRPDLYQFYKKLGFTLIDREIYKMVKIRGKIK